MKKLAVCRSGVRLPVWNLNWAKIVPRLAILGEWEGFGEVCWKWIVLLGLNLRFFMVLYALLQRMGIFADWAVMARSDFEKTHISGARFGGTRLPDFLDTSIQAQILSYC
jgi:hypothetical protein